MRKARSPSQRQLRVGETLRHVLVDVLGRGGLRDPALQDVSITVSEVRVSPDLKNATAFVMPLGGQHADDVVAALGRASSYLRSAVAAETQLRFAPRIVFELDNSFTRASEIDALLRRPEVAQDLQDDDLKDEDLPDDEDGDDSDGS
jgi:ribosome-binding factor A